MSLVLFAPDVATIGSPAAERWVVSVCRDLIAQGHKVLFHPRERGVDSLTTVLRSHGVLVLPYDAQEPEHEDSHGHMPRFRARRVVAVARTRQVDWVLAQGRELCLVLAGGRAVRDRLIALPLDVPFRTEQVEREVLSRISGLLGGSRRLLVVSESQRAVLESEAPHTTSKVLLMPPLTKGNRKEPGEARPGTASLEINLDYMSEASLPDMEPYVAVARSQRTVPPVYLTGHPNAPLADGPVWRGIPGRRLGNALPSEAPAYGLLPSSADPVARAHAIQYYLDRGTTPVLIDPDPAHRHDDHVLVLPSTAELLHPHVGASVTPAAPQTPLAGPPTAPLSILADTPVVAAPSQWFPGNRTSEDLGRADGSPLRVVVAGSDFKFAGDLITALAEHPGIDLRVDLFEHHATVQPDTSKQYLEWADVVIAEFAHRHAVWYSERIRDHQRLIVHLHGFELLSDWIDELRADRCSAIVVASDFYRRQALAMKEWPADRVVVLPNSVSDTDLRREKFEDARFHLGLVGYVPILKRPDRAVDLLRLLRREDERYTLHLRGHSPWNYQWEWKKSAHQDAYRSFFEAIGTDPLLSGGVAFEPFGPDMGNWLRRIGWILSPSSRETFHLAGVEGAASGAVPLVWERTGSKEIFSERWNFGSTEEIADFVLSRNADPDSYAAEATQALEFAGLYSARTVTDRWIALVRDAWDRPDETTTPVSVRTLDTTLPAGSPERVLLHDVEATLADGTYEDALTLLDAGISTTARSTSLLKDAELWVRGVAALDARRFSLFLPPASAPDTRGERPLTVRRAGASSQEFARRGLELDTIDLSPYPYTDPREARVRTDSSEIQPDSAGSSSRMTAQIRGDRWLEAHTGSISARALELGADRLVARGPWWTALAAALAADRLGLPCTWAVTDPVDIARAEAAIASPYSADFIEQVTLRTFQGMTTVVDETGDLAGSTLSPHLAVDTSPSDSPVDQSGGRRQRAPQDYAGVAEALERPVGDLVVLVAGTDSYAKSWEASGATVVRLRPDQVGGPVSPTVDLLAIDASAADDPQWGPLLTSPKAAGPSEISRTIDRARAAGCRILATAHALNTWPPTLTATLRKVDVLTARDVLQSQPILALNPLAVERVVPVTDEHPWVSDPARFLRRVGLAARIDRVPEPPKTEDHVARDVTDASPVTPQEAVEAAELEGLSLILATHRGASRLPGMLESLARQTLPHHLMELIVVENGGEPECRELVEEFSARAGIATRYVYEPSPGVGRARNIALSMVSRPYLCFIDDDDLLEPEFLLAAWLSASTQDVVLSPLHDVSMDGSRNDRTAVAGNVESLGGGRVPLALRPWGLGQNACKLIPADSARECRYPEEVRSGEDVAFMAQLLGRGLHFVPAAPMADNAYLRVLRENSVSRRELTFDFAVRDRLGVITDLHSTRRRLTDPDELAAVQTLITAQSGFVSRYRDAHPDEAAEVDAAVRAAGLEGVVVLP